VLLYWGATWCPPCNQLKATLFNRQPISSEQGLCQELRGGAHRRRPARRAAAGQPLQGAGLSDDDPDDADGTEITRLPGEADAPQVLNAAAAGPGRRPPGEAVLADARAGKPVSANEWRMLAFYSWDTDEAQLVPPPSGRPAGPAVARHARRRRARPPPGCC
jgi:hypothetical protein